MPYDVKLLAAMMRYGTMYRKSCTNKDTMPLRYLTATPLVEFNFIRMIRAAGPRGADVWPAAYTQDKARRQFERIFIAGNNFCETDAVWPLLEIFGIHLEREQVDQAAQTRLPGYVFCSPLFKETPDPRFCAQPLLCVDPALVLGVIGRVTGRFYRAAQPPDYSIAQMMRVAVLCNEIRIPVELCAQEERVAS